MTQETLWKFILDVQLDEARNFEINNTPRRRFPNNFNIMELCECWSSYGIHDECKTMMVVVVSPLNELSNDFDMSGLATANHAVTQFCTFFGVDESFVLQKLTAEE